jgi:hypothetical protein
MRWAGYGEMRNAYKIFDGKSEGKRPLRRPRNKWTDNIKMDIWETGLKGVYWIHLAQDRHLWQTPVNMIMSLRVPQKAEYFLTS